MVQGAYTLGKEACRREQESLTVREPALHTGGRPQHPRVHAGSRFCLLLMCSTPPSPPLRGSRGLSIHGINDFSKPLFFSY